MRSVLLLLSKSEHVRVAFSRENPRTSILGQTFFPPNEPQGPEIDLNFYNLYNSKLLRPGCLTPSSAARVKRLSLSEEGKTDEMGMGMGEA